MSVVRREARRRWILVAAAVAVLCALPAVVAAWPAPAVSADPVALRTRILASANVSYSGDAATNGTIQLPDVPALADIAGLLKTMRLRAWYSTPEAWRVAVLTLTGEHDIYRTPIGTYTWDYERDLTTLAAGNPPVRLPYAADLLPPDLARRLIAAEPAATAIGARRIAGVDAAGLRVTPSDPDSTVGHVDVWADPQTGLPVQVEVVARTGGDPVFTSRFLDVDQRNPDAAVLVPAAPEHGGFTTTTSQDVTQTVNTIAPIPLPSTLTGRARVGGPLASSVVGLAGYGSGLSMFVVLALTGGVGNDTLNGIRNRGGVPVSVPNATAYETSTTLVNGLVVQSNVGRRNRRTYLLAGPVAASVLRQAASELLAAGPVSR
jgi:hypothetical protein